MTGIRHKERRWIVLSEDGRHVTLGRHSDPTPDEIDHAGEALEKMGLGGWLAVLEGGYYGRGSVSLMQVRALGAKAGTTWEVAVEAFLSARHQAIAPAKARPPSPGPC